MSECFVVSSRGWELDQSKLLRSLDRIGCANFSRVQIVSTMNRVVENVRSHVDAVVIHIGSHELTDAAHSIGEGTGRDGIASIASSVATVMSRQVGRKGNLYEN
jgi:CO dehydrogenase/acetyl-CoA synthase alpha subunit